MNKSNRFKALFCATVVGVSVLLTPFVALASGGDSSLSGVSQGITAKTISINVRNADTRDVLSAVAVNMGLSIVYSGSVATVTIKIDNVPPAAAFDYILKSMGMTYLQEGSTLIVGTREQLNSAFARSLSVTRFDLKYISPAVLTSKITQLALPVTVVTLASNEDALWVQGFPSDIAKVRELIAILDIEENLDNSGVDSVDHQQKTLSYIKLNDLTAYEFNRFLKTLGVNNGLSISDEDDRLYIYATPDERKTINDIRNKVDRVNGAIDVSNSDAFETLHVINIAKATAISAINAICPNLSVISVDNAAKAFFVNGAREDIDRAQELISELDTVNASRISTTFFNYHLEHITAAAAARRLENITFGDSVKWYLSNYGEFAQTIFIYCNSDYREQMEELLEGMDSARMDTYNVVIYRASTEEYVEGMRDYISNMLGTAVSDHLSVLPYANAYLLYLEDADAEMATLVDATIERLQSVPSDEDKKTDTSWEAFVKYMKDEEDVTIPPNYDDPKSVPYYATYIQWVKSGGSKNSSTFSMSPNDFIFAPPVVTPSVPSIPGTASPDGTLTPPGSITTPPGSTTTPPESTTTPPDGASPLAKELVEQAVGVLTHTFDVTSDAPGTFIPGSATTDQDVLAVAQDALKSANLTAVSVAIAADSHGQEMVIYAAPTTEFSGKLTVTLSLSADGIVQSHLVSLDLPKSPVISNESGK